MQSLELPPLILPSKIAYHSPIDETFGQIDELEDVSIWHNQQKSILGKNRESFQKNADSKCCNSNKYEITEWDSTILDSIQLGGKLRVLNKKIIEQTYFFNLTRLNLSSNYIVSIELLSSLNAPHLKTLTMSDNMISSLRSLRRASFEQLEQLMIDVNEIQDLGSLTEANMSSLAVIRVDRCYWKSNGEDFSFLAKLQTLKLRHCGLEKRFRIGRLNLEKTLERKYAKNRFNI